MKIVTVKQNGREWHAWRGRGLGASDAPAVMGESPWTTRFELWLEKTGLCERAPANEFAIAAMRRGTDLEPVARTLVENQLGLAYPSISAEHDEHSFIRASFDGYDEASGSFIEIKCPNKVSHAKAVKAEIALRGLIALTPEYLAAARKGIPDNYYSQIQQQFLVSGARRGYYCSFDGVSDRVAIVPMYPDAEYISRLRHALIDFWTRVQTQMPPEVTNEDLVKFAARVDADTQRLSASVKALSIAVGR